MPLAGLGALTDLFHLIRCTILMPLSTLHPPPPPWCPCLFGCLILNCNMFSRRRSSSALSNPSWQPSPSSCRPLANIMMEILSEHHLSFIAFHSSCISRIHAIASGLICCLHAQGNNLQVKIIISPPHSRHDGKYFELKAGVLFQAESSGIKL